MCCLKYEQDAYEDLLKVTPKVGAYVSTNEGKGTVVEVNLLTGLLKVKLDKNINGAPVIYSKNDVKLIRDAEIQLNPDDIKALKELEE